MNTRLLKWLFAILLFFHFSCESGDKEFEKRAYRNMDKVQIGDDSIKVLEIMGEPQKKYLDNVDSSIIIYDYGRIVDNDIDTWNMTIRLNVDNGSVRGKSKGEKK